MPNNSALSALAALVAEIDAGEATALEIERFLTGESDGSVLFHALYGAVADEPIPERLLAVLRHCSDEPECACCAS